MRTTYISPDTVKKKVKEANDKWLNKVKKTPNKKRAWQCMPLNHKDYKPHD